MHLMTPIEKLFQWMTKVGLEKVLTHPNTGEVIKEEDTTIFDFWHGSYKFTVTHQNNTFTIE